MFEALYSFITETLVPLGFLGVFFGSVIEEAWAPIPSAIVVVTAGIAFVTATTFWGVLGQLLWYVMIPASLGITLGSLIIYYLSLYFGKPFVEKWGKWFGLKWEDIEKVEEKYEEGNVDWYSVFVLRMIPVIPNVVINAFAGFTRVPLWTYITASISGLMIRTGILGLIGWQAGDLYNKYTNIFEDFEKSIIALIALVIFMYPLYKYFSRKKAL